MESADVEIVNPDRELMTLDSDDVTIEMDLTVERGVGYLAAERTEQLPIGVIPVDAIFTPGAQGQLPGREHARRPDDQLRQADDRDRDRRHDRARGGALAAPPTILVGQFSLFTTIGQARSAADRGVPGVPQLPPNMLDMPIEELDLPMRAYNSLKRNNIVKVGQLLQLQDEDLLRMRNFGKKSLDEMKERLRMRGFIPPETEASELRRRRVRGRRRRRGRGGLSMAHRIDGRKLGRKTGPRMALYRNLTCRCCATSGARPPRRGPRRSGAASRR